jgi:hypothetical protein
MRVYESSKAAALMFSDQQELSVEYSSKQLQAMMEELQTLQVQ